MARVRAILAGSGSGGAGLVLFAWLAGVAIGTGTAEAACTVGPAGTITCTGDEHGGVFYTNPPYSTLNVNTLSADIGPASGVPGIEMRSQGADGSTGSHCPILDPTCSAGGPGGPGGAGGDLTIDFDGDEHVIATQGNEAHGIVAISQGGTGGRGGDEEAVTSGDGGNGGVGGSGGEVKITSDSSVTTTGDGAYGVFADSRGGTGGRGGDGGGTAGYGGNGATGGAGDDATVLSDSAISTSGEAAHGIFARSMAGAGGTGGTGKGVDGEGGNGGAGGTGGLARAESHGVVITSGPNSIGIVAQSLGGAGGNGGDGEGLVGDGGAAAGPGPGGDAEVISSATVETHGEEATGILAQSIGGFGGTGGTGSGFVSFAGSGANSRGWGGEVTITNSGSVSTAGTDSRGLHAQSIGGGGGAAGSAAGAVALGATGAVGGDGGAVRITNSGAIETLGDGSHALSGQSIGGGGGAGSSTGGVVALGSQGAGGGAGGSVTITNTGTGHIQTFGDHAVGIYAESIGGGGGDGGSAGGLVGIGGSGSATSPGGSVDVDNSQAITTGGDWSRAIFAQSLGGGGGNGGTSTGLITIGGSGDGGGDGSTVTVSNSGALSTGGDDAAAVFAQSVGGGGGNGGRAISAGTYFSLAIGGGGAAGGAGSTVTINPTADVDTLTAATIQTTGDRSHGIQAQSIGGGGGNGGLAFSGSVGGGFSASVALGGTGGPGGAAEAVTVNERGAITATGAQSYGIFAQSIGGGGGNGGGAVTVSGGIGGYSLGFSMGGGGGSGGDAGTVTVNARGGITTTEALSYGLFAQSVGGGGGNGGFSVAATAGSLSGSVALGGSGGGGGFGNDVTVNVAQADSGTGTIETSGAGSHALFAQSVGGGGGNGGFAAAGALGSSSVSVALGGDAGGGNVGGLVDVTNADTILTHGEGAIGLFAQSVGGSGGNGGFSLGASGGVMTAAVAVGGSGGIGSGGGEVMVNNSGDITTAQDLAYGILAQSVGGGGGNGGSSVAATLAISVKDVPAGAAAVAIGGDGGEGGVGGAVDVANSGSIVTGTERPVGEDIVRTGNAAHAIFAQSVGGGGGNGGFAGSASVAVGTGGAFAVSVGGDGGDGNRGGAVDVASTGGALTTYGDGADGIHAQSVGGGGGDGGFGLALAAGFGGEANLNVSVAIGGAGGVGGAGETVGVGNSSEISTVGDRSNGIFAQSVGGGGGNGGFAVSGTLGLAESAGQVGVAVGGSGGDGGIGELVMIDNDHAITTAGVESIGILGQSIGGGGGNGGLALTAQLTGATKSSATVGVSVGGGGGSGNSAGVVEITNDFGGQITTTGFGSHGIKGQSIGGGGGNGGMAIVAQVGVAAGTEQQATKTLNVGVAVGGSGGDGGSGNSVNVTNRDSIEVMGDTATGIFAQSIGGGGGDGGGAINAVGMLTDSTNSDSRSVVADVTVGGGGGDGNHGGAVTVDNAGSITTHSVSGYGVYAQSVGGGGGIGGRANTFALVVTDECTVPELCTESESEKNNFQLGVTVGGGGGIGNHGGTVTVNNTGEIETFGNASDGIYAQSIGGGGGNAGNGILGSGELGPLAEAAEELAGSALEGAVSFYENLQVVVGGDAGSSGDGGTVEVNNDKNITTHGSNSDGVFAQSVGGGGGVGGKAAIGATGTLGLGGAGGAAGNGGNVTVDQFGGATIETFGTASHGIFAQSVGGGGGIAGNIDRNLTAAIETPIPGVTIPSLNLGVGLAFGRSGGDGGNGGSVRVDVDGQIITHGDNAAGIFAQSVGGGGGVLGELGNNLPVLSLLSWQIGSAGDAGDAGLVDVNLTGGIVTAGNNATGIFAQSAGGTGTAGAVSVTLNSSILTGEVLQSLDERRGLGSIGILAQSVASDNADNDDITISIDSADAVVRGGRSSVIDVDRAYIGVGIWVMDGKDNTITNNGLVTTLGGVREGFAILGSGSDPTHPGGNETVSNFGTVTGSVGLGSGTNVFYNRAGATFNTGSIVALGSDPVDLLNNAGSLLPGGPENVLTALLTGFFEQESEGSFLWDLDVGRREADRLEVSGTAELAGLADLNIVNLAVFHDGDTFDVLSADVIGSEFETVGLPPDSALMHWSFDYLRSATPDIFQVQLAVKPFGAVAGNRLESAVATYLDALAPNASRDLAEVLGSFQLLVPEAGLDTAFTSLSPDQYDGATRTGIDTQRQYLRGVERRMHALRARRLAGVKPKATASLQLAMTGSSSEVLSVAGLLGPAIATEQEARYTFWLDGLGQFGDQDGGDGFTGFDYSMGGGSVGIDRAFGERFVAGVNAGYSYTDLDFNGSRGDAEIDAIHGSLYGTWVTERAYVEGVLSYARQDYDNRRRVVVGAVERTARSDHDADVFGAQLGGGYLFDLQGFGLRPFASLSYVLLDEEGFQETGAGSVNLVVDDRTTNSLVSELGVRVARAFQPEVGTFVPYLSAAWKYDFDVDDRAIRSGFEGAPGTAFTVDGQDIDRHGGLIGAGVVFLRDGWTASVEYFGEFRGDYTANGVFARAGFAF